ncbi:MAG: hypothetical protein EB120_13145 [Proteobacteria bacterium]|nr:hypothetical protein [Pseudomonadota bacterium]
MKIQKYTDLISLKEIKKIISFITQYCKYDFLTTVRLLEYDKVGISGLAIQNSFGESNDLSRPSMIKIWLGKDRQYPCQDSYVPEIKVTFHDFEEELIYVMAHEFRHIDQFWTSLRRVEGHAAELDAERFALKVLNIWREKSIHEAVTESFLIPQNVA